MSAGQIKATENPQNVAFGKGNPLLSGKSRLVKYYNLVRYVLPSVKLTNRSLKMSRNPKRKGSSCYPISSIMFYINDVVKILVSPKKFVLNFPTTSLYKDVLSLTNCATIIFKEKIPCILQLNIVSCVFPFGSTLNVFTSTGAE